MLDKCPKCGEPGGDRIVCAACGASLRPKWLNRLCMLVLVAAPFGIASCTWTACQGLDAYPTPLEVVRYLEAWKGLVVGVLGTLVWYGIWKGRYVAWRLVHVLLVGSWGFTFITLATDGAPVAPQFAPFVLLGLALTALVLFYLHSPEVAAYCSIGRHPRESDGPTGTVGREDEDSHSVVERAGRPTVVSVLTAIMLASCALCVLFFVGWSLSVIVAAPEVAEETRFLNALGGVQYAPVPVALEVATKIAMIVLLYPLTRTALALWRGRYWAKRRILIMWLLTPVLCGAVQGLATVGLQHAYPDNFLRALPHDPGILADVSVFLIMVPVLAWPCVAIALWAYLPAAGFTAYCSVGKPQPNPDKIT